MYRNLVFENKVIIQPRNTLQANERLKSRKTIQRLFTEGKAFSVFPLRVLYLEMSNDHPPLQAGFTVGTKHFKKAVHRNRIKRLMRESYRLNKHTLKTSVEEKNTNLAIFFIYTGKEMPEYSMIIEKMLQALERLENSI